MALIASVISADHLPSPAVYLSCSALLCPAPTLLCPTLPWPALLCPRLPPHSC